MPKVLLYITAKIIWNFKIDYSFNGRNSKKENQ